MTTKFLNYSVSTSTYDKAKGQYVVTAEYADGYEVLSYHKSKTDADAALKRYKAADARRRAVDSSRLKR
jgi:hypothetical protein